MAKVVSRSTDSTQTSSLYSVWQIALVGAALGVMFWGMCVVFRNFLPLESAGNIAMVIVAIMAIVLMIFLKISQPLIIALATSVSLWGLASWSDGLTWAQIVAWNVILYGLSFALFSWVSRSPNIAKTVIIILAIIVVIRVVVSL